MKDSGAGIRWFAFLRAINVGGRTVRMERLRELFEELGLDQVETFIASGNVVFEAPAKRNVPTTETTLARRIETRLRDALGYEVATFLRTRPELETIAAARPFGGEPDGPVYVGFLEAPPAAEAAAALAGFANDVDAFAVVGREVHWLGRRGLGKSTFSGARLERVLGMPATLRSLNTVERLLAKYD